MADVRVGGAYVDFTVRSSKFVAQLKRNGNALRQQQRAVRALRREVSSYNRVARKMAVPFTLLRTAAVTPAGGGGQTQLVRRQTDYGAAECVCGAQRQSALAQALSKCTSECVGSSITGFAEVSRTCKSAMAEMQSDLRKLINAVATDIRKALIKTLIVDPLTERVKKTVLGIAAGLLGAKGSSGAGGGGVGHLGPGYSFARHGGYAHGMPVVGEAGPELVDFRRPGQVYSNRKLAAALSGGGTTINFAPVIESVDESGVLRALDSALPQFADVLRAEIGTDLGRPSALRRQVRR